MMPFAQDDRHFAGVPIATRRQLFLGAAAATSLAAAPLLPARSIADIWREAVSLGIEVNAMAQPDAVLQEMARKVFDLEDQVVTGPIRTKADALAKLECVGVCFERGLRDADHIEGPAHAEAIAWLRAH